jgi:hypothetical protein
LKTGPKYVTLSSEVLSLTRTALDLFETSSLDASARRTLRIAQLRGDATEAWLIRADLRPIGGSDELRIIEISSLFRDSQYEYIIEADSRFREIWIKERTPHDIPEPLSEKFKPGNLLVGSISDLQRQWEYFDVTAQTEKERSPKAHLMLDQRAAITAEIIERIRFRIYSYLCRVEAELNFSATNKDVFEQYRLRVDSVLSNVATDVLTQFTAAYERMMQGDMEARTHALTSCRRIFKSIADRVYPAQPKPALGGAANSRDLSDDKYINRLRQFISDSSVGDTFKRSMHASLSDVGTRITKLYDLACKGVHDEVSIDEVEWCVVQTYLIVGEILRLVSAVDNVNSTVSLAN